MIALGWILTLLPSAALVMSAVFKFLKPPAFMDGFKHLGWNEDAALGLGILDLVCAVIYLFPRTAVFGAILITGYFGGAVATHVRVGDSVGQAAPPIVLGVLAWLGLLLRDKRLRALLPFRTVL
jgi:hypothetical protein